MNGNDDRLWKLLGDWNIPILPMAAASSPGAAVEAAKTLGHPVVMKLLSPDITHKSDVGGVILDLGSDNEVKDAYNAMMKSVEQHLPEARIEGVLLQKMAGPGLEVIVGAKLDPQFGHVIMFGLGGIFVEICRDVSFRVTPVDREMAREMVLEIKGSPIIEGARGREPADLEAIIDVIIALSSMLEKNPDITEIDINPLIVYSMGSVVVDARMLTK
jgi:acyl-CoA synthetase (NDP forming)